MLNAQQVGNIKITGKFGNFKGKIQRIIKVFQYHYFSFFKDKKSIAKIFNDSVELKIIGNHSCLNFFHKCITGKFK